jgi:hypothetical protein
MALYLITCKNVTRWVNNARRPIVPDGELGSDDRGCICRPPWSRRRAGVAKPHAATAQCRVKTVDYVALGRALGSAAELMNSDVEQRLKWLSRNNPRQWQWGNPSLAT